LHNYLAGIYLNTQEADTSVGNLTYIPACARTHVLVTYQIPAY